MIKVSSRLAYSAPLSSPPLPKWATYAATKAYYGQARIQAGGAPELLQRLAEVYIGPGVKFPPMENPPADYVTRIRVDRIEGVGPWTGRPV